MQEHKTTKRPMELNVNGGEYQVLVRDGDVLSAVLREQLELIGTKEGCQVGECGACTVLLDGLPVLSCLLPAVEAEGCRITTIEGLADGETLHPLQQSFVDHGAVQCGFCTPGMILTASELLRRNPHPDESDIRQAIAGNMCRCTGYTKIVEAVQAVADGEDDQ